MKKTILLVLALILTACSLGGSELLQNQNKWNTANIIHYRFKLNIGCFCVFGSRMPLTIEVQNGAVASIAASDGNIISKTDTNYEYFSRYATMNRIFIELNSEEVRKADKVAIQYDATYGFPTNVSIDFIKNAIDDEVSLNVSDFEKLP